MFFMEAAKVDWPLFREADMPNFLASLANGDVMSPQERLAYQQAMNEGAQPQPVQPATMQTISQQPPANLNGLMKLLMAQGMPYAQALAQAQYMAANRVR